MQTECRSPQPEFEALGRRRVVGKFDGGRMTSDAGALCCGKPIACTTSPDVSRPASSIVAIPSVSSITSRPLSQSG